MSDDRKPWDTPAHTEKEVQVITDAAMHWADPAEKREDVEARVREQLEHQDKVSEVFRGIDETDDMDTIMAKLMRGFSE